MEDLFTSRRPRAEVIELLRNIGELTDDKAIEEIANQIFEMIKPNPEMFTSVFFDEIDNVFKQLNSESLETRASIINILDIVTNLHINQISYYANTPTISRICNLIELSKDNPETHEIQVKLLNILTNIISNSDEITGEATRIICEMIRRIDCALVGKLVFKVLSKINKGEMPKDSRTFFYNICLALMNEDSNEERRWGVESIVLLINQGFKEYDKETLLDFLTKLIALPQDSQEECSLIASSLKAMSYLELEEAHVSMIFNFITSENAEIIQSALFTLEKLHDFWDQLSGPCNKILENITRLLGMQISIKKEAVQLLNYSIKTPDNYSQDIIEELISLLPLFNSIPGLIDHIYVIYQYLKEKQESGNEYSITQFLDEISQYKDQFSDLYDECTNESEKEMLSQIFNTIEEMQDEFI